MSVSHAVWNGFDARGELRDSVYHRAGATLDNGAALPLLIVNISPSGLMARSTEPLAPGATLAIALPVVGRVRAEVRWALGGRVGCQLERSIPSSRYY